MCLSGSWVPTGKSKCSGLFLIYIPMAQHFSVEEYHEDRGLPCNRPFTIRCQQNYWNVSLLLCSVTKEIEKEAQSGKGRKWGRRSSSQSGMSQFIHF